MQDKLVIVESPSKAKTIKKYLGEDYEVIASQGHIIDLPVSKFGINVDDNFKIDYINIKGKAKLINEIKKLAKDKKYIYLATDPDREGEAIAYHLKNVLNIKDDEKCRIEFHEITKKAVTSAINKAKVVNNNIVAAQQTRRVLDRIVGYKISPLLWQKIKKGLSAGRVQSVTLKIIMDKEREIRNFKKQEYWNISAILNKIGDDKDILAKFYGDKDGKIEVKNEEDANKIYKLVKNNYFKIIDIIKSEKRRNSPPPFTTSSMGQEASRKLSFTMKKTMMLAQKLYEAGYITYMRTDSVRISDDAVKMAKDYIIDKYSAKYYLNREFKTSSNAQDAHEAIRPTNLSNLEEIYSKLENDELKLFKLICNRFLASQMSPAVYDTTKVKYDVNNYIFTSNGSTIKFDGFMKLYIEDKDDGKKDEIDDDTLPNLDIDEMLIQKELKKEQKFTEPPYRYTEATLVKTLEEKGIGRPSTYAPTISTILDRLYAEKDKKFIVPTELGEIVNEVMENNFKDIVDEKFTASMENDLDEIAKGNKTYLEVVSSFYDPFIKNLNEVSDKIQKIKLKEEESDVICEFCGRNMVVKQGRYGKFLACPGFPECKNIKSIINKIDVPCPKCGGDVVIKKTKTGRMFYVCSNNTNNENSKCDYISWSKPTKK